MKELSIEEKTNDSNYKAYTELINRLEDVKDAIKKQNYGIAMDILYKPYPEFQITTFTELKENEDEKIRKQITGFITYSKVLDETKKNWLAWLEKQGEHANFINKIQIGDKVTRNEDGVLVNLSQLKRVAKKGEKQGEQKSADKVEPKFRKGDWVVDKNGIVKKILSYNNGVYKHTDGYSAQIFEDEWRLWDITKDAKDGDVLAVTMYPEGTWIGIFKEQNGCTFSSHCFVNTEGTFKLGTYNHGNGKAIHPATKEQRDLLFQKIHEAGYEWDADKKELKKIEQKPTWSEEDEYYLNSCITKIEIDIQNWEGHGKTMIDVDKEIISWLKSLKDRVQSQPKQEWSEEDEKMYNVVHNLAWESYKTSRRLDIPTFRIINDWLKSLKPQNTWKPSDEQMEALKMTIDIQIEEYGFSSLNTLFEQLKSL